MCCGVCGSGRTNFDGTNDVKKSPQIRVTGAQLARSMVMRFIPPKKNPAMLAHRGAFAA